MLPVTNIHSLCDAFLSPHPLAFLLRRSILLLDILLKFRVGPVEEDLCALAGYQQTLHLDHRHSAVLLHWRVLLTQSTARSLCCEENGSKTLKWTWGGTLWSLKFWQATIHSWGCRDYIWLITHLTTWSIIYHGTQFKAMNINLISTIFHSQHIFNTKYSHKFFLVAVKTNPSCISAPSSIKCT